MSAQAFAPRGAGRHNITIGLLDDPLVRGHERRPALRDGEARVTYAELSAAAGSAAAWLADRGIGRGDRLLLALPDGPEWVALFLGACRIGAAPATASPALPAGRLHEAAARLRPRAALVAGPWPAALGAALPVTEARAAVAGGLPDPGPVRLRAHEPGHLLLTSGSTGPPKWAAHRAGDIAACVATYGRRVLRLRPDDVTWSVAALPTSYGLGNSCYFPLAAGACAALAGADRSPAACAAACRERGATVVLGVPTFWARLARHVVDGRVAREDLSGVRLAVSAGEHLPAELWRVVRRATGLGLVNGLGSSEATNLYLSDRPGDPRPGTVGHVVPGYALRIRPEEGDGPDEGELLVRGPTVMAGYHGDPEGTARALEGGWLATGDRVRREPDGSHTYLGRRGDRFKAGGLWVDAARVARALRAHDGVRDALVLPLQDPDGLLRVGAAAVARPGGRARVEAELPAVVAEHLLPHEAPRALLVLAAFPTTSSGKVDRAELRRRLTAALAPRSASRRAVP